VRRFIINLFTAAAVCGFLVCVWALTSGSFHDVERVVRDPALARELGFWPIWVILAWATLLVIHLGIVLATLPRSLASERARQRRQRAARAAARAGTEVMERSVQAAHALAGRREQTRQATPERHWVTVMFVDVVDSTRLAETLGDDEWSQVLARYRSLVRTECAARGGDEVGTQGDGFLVRFPGPADAVLAGVDVQREIDGIATDAFDFRVRVGVHAGEAVEDEGDLVGRVINLAARVTAEALPGEILVTEPVADYVGGRLRLEDRGLRPLRGVAQPRHLLAVVWGDAPDTPYAPPGRAEHGRT
jgi:class 3 adenylate cyclase